MATKSDLTQREMEVARLLVDDLSRNEIATQLGISIKTVDQHCTNVFRKFEVGNKKEFVEQWRSGPRGVRSRGTDMLQEWYTNTYRIQSMISTYRFGQPSDPRVPVQSEAHRVVVAQEDGVHEIFVVAQYYSDVESVAFDLRCEGASVTERRELANGAYMHTLSLGTALRRGQAHTVSTWAEFNTNVESKPLYYHWALAPVDALALRVQFAADATPTTAWSFVMPPHAAPGQPSEGATIPPNEIHCADMHFNNLELSFAYGIGWIW